MPEGAANLFKQPALGLLAHSSRRNHQEGFCPYFPYFFSLTDPSAAPLQP